MSSIHLYKYSGAGNDFIVLADGICSPDDAGSLNAEDLCTGCQDTGECGLPSDICEYRKPEIISRLCDRKTGIRAADGRIGADGLMILSLPEGGSRAADFRMEYYNSDGSGGMMCGNGGRCIVAFADFLGIRPRNGAEYVFEAPDGMHSGEILSKSGNRCTVRLKMIDAFGLRRVLGGWFLNTGTRHFVLFTGDVDAVDVESEGARLRHNPEFAPEGANVNFVSQAVDGSLRIRTFEKGVEAETLACGTGITAAAIAAWYAGISPDEGQDISANASQGTSQGPRNGTHVHYRLHARIDDLSVDFSPVTGGTAPGEDGQRPQGNSSAGTHSQDPEGTIATGVYLTGPAEKIG